MPAKPFPRPLRNPEKPSFFNPCTGSRNRPLAPEAIPCPKDNVPAIKPDPNVCALPRFCHRMASRSARYFLSPTADSNPCAIARGIPPTEPRRPPAVLDNKDVVPRPKLVMNSTEPLALYGSIKKSFAPTAMESKRAEVFPSNALDATTCIF